MKHYVNIPTGITIVAARNFKLNAYAPKVILEYIIIRSVNVNANIKSM
jgi:hypothetical protein